MGGVIHSLCVFLRVCAHVHVCAHACLDKCELSGISCCDYASNNGVSSDVHYWSQLVVILGSLDEMSYLITQC